MDKKTKIKYIIAIIVVIVLFSSYLIWKNVKTETEEAEKEFQYTDVIDELAKEKEKNNAADYETTYEEDEIDNPEDVPSVFLMNSDIFQSMSLDINEIIPFTPYLGGYFKEKENDLLEASNEAVKKVEVVDAKDAKADDDKYADAIASGTEGWHVYLVEDSYSETDIFKCFDITVKELPGLTIRCAYILADEKYRFEVVK